MTTPAPPLTEAELAELLRTHRACSDTCTAWKRIALTLESELADSKQSLEAASLFARALIARIDGDGGHAQRDESLQFACYRADQVVTAMQGELAQLRQRSAFLEDVTPYLRRHLLDDITPAIGEPRDSSPMGIQLQSWFARLAKLEHGEPDPELAQLRRELERSKLSPVADDGTCRGCGAAVNADAPHRESDCIDKLRREKAERTALETRRDALLCTKHATELHSAASNRLRAYHQVAFRGPGTTELLGDYLGKVGTGPTYEAALAAALEKVEKA